MKKFIVILCAAILLAPQVEARHHNGWGIPTPHHRPVYHPSHHHHGGNAFTGFVTGLIGGTLLNAALNQPQPTITTTTYTPVVYTTPVVTSSIVTTPTVISAPVTQVVPVATTTQPCYTTTNIVTGATATHCSSTIISSQIYIGN